jgi:hypothetical protein
MNEIELIIYYVNIDSKIPIQPAAMYVFQGAMTDGGSWPINVGIGRHLEKDSAQLLRSWHG